MNSPENCQPVVGPAAIARNYQSLIDEIPDVHDVVKSIIVDGPLVAVEFVASGHVDGIYFEIPIAAVLTIENGMIVKDRAYLDTQVVLNCAESRIYDQREN